MITFYFFMGELSLLNESSSTLKLSVFVVGTASAWRTFATLVPTFKNRHSIPDQVWNCLDVYRTHLLAVNYTNVSASWDLKTGRGASMHIWGASITGKWGPYAPAAGDFTWCWMAVLGTEVWQCRDPGDVIAGEVISQFIITQYATCMTDNAPNLLM